MTSEYRIAGGAVKSEDSHFPELLASAYAVKERPLCLCREPGIEMYLSKVAGKIVIKRMPNTGGDHAAACESYEPPPELSGLGQVMGSAILEDPDNGQTALKLDFSLTKSPNRAAPIPSGAEADVVKTDGNKLSLRGMLHYLWEEAGFNKWSPSMQGKRSWYVIRKFLMLAAEDKIAKGASLGDILYIPESFNLDKQDEIAQRRIAQMSKVATPQNGTRRLMLLIGEVKEIGQSRYGYKIVLKHLPDCPFMLNEDLHKRIKKRFEVELGLWDALEDTRLIIIGTFGVGSTGIPTLEEVALMSVTDAWLPIDHTFDKSLVDAMVKDKRRFIKGLRYNLPTARPLACMVASDTQPNPTALYVIPPSASDDYVNAVAELIANSKMASWEWRAGAVTMPALPK